MNYPYSISLQYKYNSKTYSSRANKWWLPRTMFWWLFSISKLGDSITALGNLYQCSVTHSKKVFHNVQMESPVLQLVTIASGPITWHCWKESGSVFFTPSHQVFIDIDEISHTPSLLQDKLSQLSQAFLICEVHKSLTVLAALHWTFSSISCTEEPRIKHSAPGVALPMLSREKGSPLSPCCQCFSLCVLGCHHLFLQGYIVGSCSTWCSPRPLAFFWRAGWTF